MRFRRIGTDLQENASQCHLHKSAPYRPWDCVQIAQSGLGTSLSSLTTSTSTSSFPEKKRCQLWTWRKSRSQMKTVTVTVFCEHQSKRKYKPLPFPSRLVSSRRGNKRIIHHCLFRADWIPVAVINRLYSTVFCEQTRFQSPRKYCLLQADWTPVASQKNNWLGWKHPLSKNV